VVPRGHATKAIVNPEKRTFAAMIYPTRLTDVWNGLTLLVPEPELVKPSYERLLKQHVATTFPFWAKIWPSAMALTSFLQAEPDWIRDKRVLELGAGIGLPSFFIARLAKEVVISDHSPEAVELAEKNILHLGLAQVRALQADWNELPEDLIGETVLMSDVNYSPDQFGPLLAVITKFIENGATVILATPQRLTAAQFVEALRPYIHRITQQSIDGQGQTTDISILILSL
jgi:predicted nicotinamide N-methyase